MDIRKIRKIIELIENSSISKIKISEGTKSISINRLLNNNSNIQSPIQTIPVISQPIINQSDSSKIINHPIVNKNNDYIIRSPMVGIFYRTTTPDEKPFIEIGQKINIGDTLCIVEAMKMMNHIESDKSGIVKTILVDNGQPVEFDEPLIILE
ncbi:MAG: acetyl-CoA carboxylase biotin carboxyl carrier protein [Pantoea sp. Brub]|nr:acetyl-CoA carboxylase biotin carboxyl carrier protein [Pantoea sp. Brub]